MTLPQNLSVKGGLIINKCNSLETLPQNLSIQDYLSICSCFALKTLPKNFSVKGHLYLMDNNNLTISEGLSVSGNMWLCNFDNLRALPENITVRGDLSLMRCFALKTLPDELNVGGSFTIEYGQAIETLPKVLDVGGSFNIESCPAIVALPKVLHVGGDFKLKSCPALMNLPTEEWSVGGDLDLENWAGQKALPEKLSIGGDLSLKNWTELATLPEKLTVQKSLNLSGCHSLEFLSEDISFGGDLDLRNCTNLTTLPNMITTLGSTYNNLCRNVYLQDTGLSDTLIDHLRNSTTENMEFHFFQAQKYAKKTFSSIKQGFTFWRDLASSDAEIPEFNLNQFDENNVINYLEKLVSTADYQNKISRSLLAERVMILMSLLTQGDSIKRSVLDQIDSAITSCGDRVILGLDNLATMKLLHDANTLASKKDSAQELRALGLKMMRLDKVNSIAREHKKEKGLKWVDEIEVELAFQIGVRQKLDLPGSTQHMVFRSASRVSDDDISNAIEQVSAYCSEENIQAFLAQWDPWKKNQRLLDVTPYDKLPEKK